MSIVVNSNTMSSQTKTHNGDFMGFFWYKSQESVVNHPNTAKRTF